MLGLKIINRYNSKDNKYIKLYLSNGSVVDEHRYIMTNYLNRELSYNDVVHHKDGNKKNNDISNLELLSRKEHASGHGIKQDDEKYITLKCDYCGQDFNILISKHKYRISKSQCNFFCSRSCTVKNQWKERNIHL